MTMFKAVLASQWKWSWGTVLLCAVSAFAIPILSVKKAAAVTSRASLVGADAAGVFLSTMDAWGAFYTLVAAALGLGLAVLAWSADHRGRHVYALVLPVARWRFVLLRFLSGSSMLVIPAAALLIGCVIAAASVTVPDGLAAYPVALTFRFLLAAWVAFALFFAISAGTTRTAALILVPVVVVASADAILASVGFNTEIAQHALIAIFDWPGIMEVFTGRWLLIDV